MAVQGISARDFFDLATEAWRLYQNVKDSRKNLGNLTIDLEALLVNVGSLDKGHTLKLVAEYIDDGDDAYSVPRDDGLTAREIEVRALRNGLHSVILPLYEFFEQVKKPFVESDRRRRRKNSKKGVNTEPLSKDLSAFGVDATNLDKYGKGPGSTCVLLPDQNNDDKESKASWFNWVKRIQAAYGMKDQTELRSRFTMQVTNLNLFMTRLTHNQLQKQANALSLKWTEQVLLNDNWQYDGHLSASRENFRNDVAIYVKYLLDGGPAFTSNELDHKALEHQMRQKSVSELMKRREREKIAIEQEMRARHYQGKSVQESNPAAGRSPTVKPPYDSRTSPSRRRYHGPEVDYDSDNLYESDLDYDLSTSTSPPIPASDINRYQGEANRQAHKNAKQSIQREEKEREQNLDLPFRIDEEGQEILTSARIRLANLNRSTIWCDKCDENIDLGSTYYSCSSPSLSTGPSDSTARNCGGGDDDDDDDNSYDICADCYEDEGLRCPGWMSGRCGAMDQKIALKSYDD